MNLSAISMRTEGEIAPEMRFATGEKSNHFHSRHRLCSGEIRDVEVHANPIDLDGTTVLYTGIHDVSRSMRTENKLRAANSFLENMLSNVHCLIACLDSGFNLTRVNQAFANTFGRSQEYFTGRNYFEVCPDEHCEPIFQKVARTGKSHAAFEDPMGSAPKPDGTTTYWDWSLHPVQSENGSVESLVLCKVDRTRHKIAQDELAVERDKLTGILEAMQDGVYIIKSDYSIEYLNPVAVKEFGPVGGRKCYEYFNRLPRTCEWCSNGDTYEGRSTRSIWTCLGNRKTYDVFDTPLRNSDGTVSKLSILHDVTEHRAVQDALRLDEARLQALLELSRMTEAIMDEITSFTLEQQVGLTGSTIGFLGLLDDNGETFSMHTVPESPRESMPYRGSPGPPGPE